MKDSILNGRSILAVNSDPNVWRFWEKRSWKIAPIAHSMQLPLSKKLPEDSLYIWRSRESRERSLTFALIRGTIDMITVFAKGFRDTKHVDQLTPKDRGKSFSKVLTIRTCDFATST